MTFIIKRNRSTPQGCSCTGILAELKSLAHLSACPCFITFFVYICSCSVFELCPCLVSLHTPTSEPSTSLLAGWCSVFVCIFLHCSLAFFLAILSYPPPLPALMYACFNNAEICSRQSAGTRISDLVQTSLQRLLRRWGLWSNHMSDRQ